jgi:hypothetical protein
VPGSRLPHFWVEGASLYDRLGSGYTLLRFDPKISVAPLEKAASQWNVPVETLDVPAANVGPAYTTSLVLARPDRHVAWRGDVLPPDVDDLVQLLRGARS